jgi:hypothetical protein
MIRISTQKAKQYYNVALFLTVFALVDIVGFRNKVSKAQLLTSEAWTRKVHGRTQIKIDELHSNIALESTNDAIRPSKASS